MAMIYNYEGTTYFRSQDGWYLPGEEDVPRELQDAIEADYQQACLRLENPAALMARAAEQKARGRIEEAEALIKRATAR